jgi:hypothetical protein
VQKQQALRPEDCAVTFTEIKVAEPAPQPRRGSIELSFANGNTLRIWGEAPAAMLEQLLRVC